MQYCGMAGIAELVKRWEADGCAWAEGLRLVQAYHPNKVWVGLLSKGESVANRILLKAQVKALPGLVAAPVAEALPVVPAKGAVAQPADNVEGRKERRRKEGGDPNDPVIQELDGVWKPAFKEANRLKAQVDHLRDPEKLGATLLEIRRLFEEVIEPAWERKDYYLAKGELPAVDERPEGEDMLNRCSVAELYAIVRRYPSRITKHEGWLKGDSDEVKANKRLELIGQLKRDLAVAKNILENATSTFIR